MALSDVSAVSPPDSEDRPKARDEGPARPLEVGGLPIDIGVAGVAPGAVGMPRGVPNDMG